MSLNPVGNRKASETMGSSVIKYNVGTGVTATAVPDAGFSFTGWSEAITSTDAVVTFTVNGDMRLTANFKKQTVITPGTDPVTVTLNADGGTGSPASVTTDANGKLTSMPVPPARNGYTFDGWFTEKVGGEQITADWTFAANTAIYARWTAVVYTITYSLNDGTLQTANPTSYTIETAAFTLNNPTREGFTFAGWTGSGITSPQTTVSVTQGSAGNRNYTANWKSNVVGTYAITYTLNGGTVQTANPTSYTAETESFTLNNPTQDGYTFAGWTGTNGTVPQTTVVVEKGGANDRYYTANWTPVTYAITYTLNGGTVASANPTSYTIETAAFTLNNPTRTGYTFTGWTGTNGTTPQTAVSVAQGSIGNKSYTANWGYETVVIGGKRWMKKNLNIETTNSWCYGYSVDSCVRYGRLYTWAAAKTACPNGWHLPDTSEWRNMIDTVGGASVAGKKLKSTSTWNYKNGTDDFGFSALPSGLRTLEGKFLMSVTKADGGRRRLPSIVLSPMLTS